MHRALVPISVVTLVLIGLVAAGRGGAGVVAQEATPATPGPARVAPEILFSTTFPAAALPTGPDLDFVVWHATIAAGARATIPADLVACCPGPLIDHLLAGELAVRVDGPLRVVRAASGGPPTPVEDVAPGTEVVLRPGDSAVHRFEFAAEYANPGPAPTHFVSGGLFGGYLPSPPPGYTLDDWDEEYPASAPPPGPVTLTMGRASLAPEGVLPGPPPGGLRVVTSGPRSVSLGERSDGSVVNLRRDAVVVYVLILRPAGTEGLTTAPGTATG